MVRHGWVWLGLALLFAPFSARAQGTFIQRNPAVPRIRCDYGDTQFCADPASHKNYKGYYVGHDEPALIFYSNVPGSGNSGVYLLTLPKDPPTIPLQDGSGGTWNFQLHPAFWIGMAICDSQSFPEFTAVCDPDTDANIADSRNRHSPDFIGHHAGTAFMELQFYPPGWVGSPELIDPVNYFAALNIDSLGESGATGAFNNLACLNTVGGETVNFAVITRNGVPILPPNPAGANFGNNNFDLTNVLEMAPGDQVLVIVRDTGPGLEVILSDLTSGNSGLMVASGANGFGQVLYQPGSATCNIAAYDFHPMYSTSNEHTRVPWTAHSFNTAFSDEIGHFEFCDDANTGFPFGCTVPGAQDTASGVDADDLLCLGPWDSFFPPAPFQQIGGCIDSELDFDGAPYGLNWPGTFSNPVNDRNVHPQPIRLAGPLFFAPSGLKNYGRIAFETDMPAFESTCDPLTGAGCSLPAPAMAFYPIYTTGGTGDTCTWQLGGAQIPGTANAFGGSAATEYGPIFSLIFQTSATTAIPLFEDFHRGLNRNPCPGGPAGLEGKIEGAMQQDQP